MVQREDAQKIYYFVKLAHLSSDNRMIISKNPSQRGKKHGHGCNCRMDCRVVQQEISNFDPEDMYRMDETGLNHHLSTLVHHMCTSLQVEYFDQKKSVVKPKFQKRFIQVFLKQVCKTTKIEVFLIVDNCGPLGPYV